MKKSIRLKIQNKPSSKNEPRIAIKNPASKITNFIDEKSDEF